MSAGEADFIARLADAWDGRGNHALRGVEQLALCRLMNLEGERIVGQSWAHLEAAVRERLVFAARQAVDLGGVCAWVFGR